MNILEEANEIVSEDRQETHGDPKDNHRATAWFWSIYIDEKLKAVQKIAPVRQINLTPEDVCFLNILQKIARTIHGEVTTDTLVDIAGYARNIEILLGEESPDESKDND